MGSSLSHQWAGRLVPYAVPHERPLCGALCWRRVSGLALYSMVGAQGSGCRLLTSLSGSHNFVAKLEVRLHQVVFSLSLLKNANSSRCSILGSTTKHRLA